MVMSSHEYNPVKSTVFGSEVVSFAFELLLLSYVVFCLVRAVHTFDFTLAIYWTPNKWRPDESDMQ